MPRTRLPKIMTAFVIPLISAAFALVVGMLLSKVYFTTRILRNSLSREVHEDLMQRRAKQYKEKITALHNKARLKISSLQQKTAEKDHEIVRLLSDACSKETATDSSTRKFLKILRAETVTLRENIDSRDERIKELNVEVRDSQAETQAYLAKLSTLQQRVEPLTQKLQQQQAIIHQFEEKLAYAALAEPAPRHDASERHDQAIEAERAPIEPTVAGLQTNADDATDDLKKIRGIGPALERRLNKSGIRRYQQIAEMTNAELANIAAKISLSPAVAARHDWIQQARTLQ